MYRIRYYHLMTYTYRTQDINIINSTHNTHMIYVTLQINFEINFSAIYIMLMNTMYIHLFTYICKMFIKILAQATVYNTRTENKAA